MQPVINMADPDYEPTDEDLERLAHEAFAGVKAANDEALRKVRQEIATLSREALARARGALASGK